MKCVLLTVDELKELLIQAGQISIDLYLKKNPVLTVVTGSQSSEPFLTVKEVVQELQVSRQTLSSWESKGLVKPHRIGRRCFYKRSELIKSGRGGNNE